MNKIFLVFFLLLVPTLAFADSTIPSWVKGVAYWWSVGNISDQEFQNAIQFLVDNGVIKVNSTQAITMLEPQQSGTNNTTISFSTSNQTTVSNIMFSLDSLRYSAIQWSNNKISDQQYFAVVQDAINAGKLGPFNGTQDEIGKTFQEIDTSQPSKTVIIHIPRDVNNNTINISVDDTIRWINEDNKTHGVTSGTKETGYDGKFFDRSLTNGTTTSFTFLSSGDFPFFSRYFDDKNYVIIHVNAVYKNNPYPSWVKLNSASWGNEQTGMQDYLHAINELYKLGYIHNP